MGKCALDQFGMFYLLQNTCTLAFFLCLLRLSDERNEFLTCAAYVVRTLVIQHHANLPQGIAYGGSVTLPVFSTGHYFVKVGGCITSTGVNF